MTPFYLRCECLDMALKVPKLLPQSRLKNVADHTEGGFCLCHITTKSLTILLVDGGTSRATTPLPTGPSSGSGSQSPLQGDEVGPF
jgi:hypothetical protein